MAFDRDAEGFEERNPVGEEGNIRGGAADVQSDGVASAAGRCQDSHDAGRRSREYRLNGKFHGFRDVKGSPVRLQDVDRNVDSPGADKMEHLIDEPLAEAPDRLIEIGRGDPAGKVEMTGHPVAQ